LGSGPWSSGDRSDTALPQAPRAHGPPSRNRDIEPGAGHDTARPANSEVHAMQTLTKLTKKIERVSALNGWRMRWHMQ
jgi:hypothetical protein